MSIRGERTREHILSVATELFAESGFSEITIKDVASACGISRGGLYRHFSSTGEIFAEIIGIEQKNALKALASARAEKIPAHKILKAFLKKRIKNAADGVHCIDNAITEFAANDPRGKELLIKRADSSIEILTDMINACIAEGTVFCKDVPNTARHIIWTIEGMSKHNALIPLTKTDIEAQTDIIFGFLEDKR